MPSFLKALSLAFCVVSTTAFQYTVSVGKNEISGQKGIGFDPSVINPAIGDIISFVFESGTHSVVQSSFDHPCTPNGNFDSGAKTVPDTTALDTPGLPMVEIYINETTPQWYFDQASGQCQQGAVFAVNPTTDQNVTTFKANAAQDTPPATASTGSATGSSTSTASHSGKTNAAAKPDIAICSATLLLLATVIGFM